MSKALAIVTVHGMGTQEENYYKALERKLRRYVGPRKWDDKVHLQSVYYQGLLQGNQERYWDEADDRHNLRWDFLRKFMLFGFSDAGSIEHSLHGNQVLYKAVHHEIASALDASLEVLGNARKPVIVLAHSLGCEQVSNYIWDAQWDKRYFEGDVGTDAQKKFRRLKSCKALVTTGCNIPLFKAGLDYAKIFDRLNKQFEWYNFFDPDDVLGYPMRYMSSSYDVSWLKDHPVNVGNFFTGWNPLSHNGYWEDRDVLKPLAKLVREYI